MAGGGGGVVVLSGVAPSDWSKQFPHHGHASNANKMRRVGGTVGGTEKEGQEIVGKNEGFGGLE